MEADLTSQAVGLASNTDFSIIGLFLRADIIVKSVIIILIASLEKLIKMLKNLRKSFGSLNLQKHFITVYQQQ
jgi:hypothetical protein